MIHLTAFETEEKITKKAVISFTDYSDIKNRPKLKLSKVLRKNNMNQLQ